MYLTQPLHRAMQQHRDRIAVCFGDRQRTFQQFGDRVARLAGGFKRLGLEAGDRVAILSLNSDRFLEYQIAVPWAGGVLNPCNIRWSAAEILYALEDSGSALLLVDEPFLPLVEQLRQGSTTLRGFIYCGDGEPPAGMHGYEELIASSAPEPDAVRRGHDLAGIFYTGGTTGFPKGVMLSHQNLMSSALAVHAERTTTPGGTYLHAAPMFHLADLGMSLPHWIEGSTHAIIRAYTPEAVLDAIERFRVTQVALVPTMIQMLLDHPSMKTARDMKSLRMIGYGGSSIPEAVLDRAMATFPDIEFVQAFGMTELAPLATINPAWYHTAEGRKAGKLRSVGRAGYICEVRVVDPSGREVPRGTVGEITVRGPQVMLGYWNRPVETAAVLRDGWMHTGDGGHMDEDGFLYIADRIKDMIISGGENIYSAEVENALMQHPAVAACAVIGVPSSRWGEAVHAVVVRHAGRDVVADALIAHCKTLIAKYKCPQSVDFVEALPLSGAGKILKVKLREQYAARPPA